MFKKETYGRVRTAMKTLNGYFFFDTVLSVIIVRRCYHTNAVQISPVTAVYVKLQFANSFYSTPLRVPGPIVT